MRLINARTRSFREFFDSTTPPYAILSHTWGDDELRFQDMQLMADPFWEGLAHAQSLTGYAKIEKACRLALDHGLAWVWVDTCCIDKSSSAELTEAINSMFLWYQEADICLVFLADLQELSGLPDCRWFTRGWTLQELLAPVRIEFYDSAWTSIGSKDSLLLRISTITGIRESVLRGTLSLEDLTVAEKMSWAAHRATTRAEDRSYCLFGIFGVNMPLIYGECNNAFRRLQEEIIRRGNDLTIFAWEHNTDTAWNQSLFASSPRDFAIYQDKFPDLTHVESHDLGIRGVQPEYSLTNSGLRLRARLEIMWHLNDENADDSYVLKLGSVSTKSQRQACTIAITLVKIGAGLFLRRGRLLEVASDQHAASIYHRTTATEPHVLTIALADNHSMMRARIRNLEWSVELSPKGSGVSYVAHAVPENLWDRTTRTFFCPHSKFHVSAALVHADVNNKPGVTLLVVIDRRSGPFARLVDWAVDGAKWKAWLFQERHAREPPTWDDLRYQIGDCVDRLAQSVVIQPPTYDPGRAPLHVTASLVHRIISTKGLAAGIQLPQVLRPRYQLVIDIISNQKKTKQPEAAETSPESNANNGEAEAEFPPLSQGLTLKPPPPPIQEDRNPSLPRSSTS